MVAIINKFSLEKPINILRRLFVDTHQINTAITFLILFGSLYLTCVSIFGIGVIEPYGTVLNSTLTENASEQLTHSAISVCFIVGFGLIIGWIFQFIHLPPLLGSILLGIFFKNVPVISDNFFVNQHWDFCLRKFAFVVIMIRCAVGINMDVVKKRPDIIITLGCFSTFVEAAAVALAAWGIFDFPVGMSIIFGFLLAASSPAVTVPSMLRFQKKDPGNNKGIPSLCLASSSVDNMVSITAYTVAIELIFAEGSIVGTIILTVVELLISVIIGLLLGCVFWVVPTAERGHFHLARGLLLLLVPSALIFGTARLGFEFAGIVCLMLMGVVLAIKWKKDNEDGLLKEQSALALLWKFCFQPILFVLIGLRFDFAQMDGQDILTGLAVLAIGVAARAIFVFIASYRPSLNYKDRILFVFTLIPKATVQAALAPSILIASSSHPEYSRFASIILNAAIIAILITAPLGQILLDIFGPSLLKGHKSEGEYNVSAAYMGPQLTSDSADVIDIEELREARKSISNSSGSRASRLEEQSMDVVV